MSIERLDVGSAPADEDCAQVGAPDYRQRGPAECRAYIRQIMRELGAPPAGLRLRVAANSHDFGTYYSVEIVFNPDNPQHWDYASNAESEISPVWDTEARKELQHDR